jgi:RNA-directed DNA polymerase
VDADIEAFCDRIEQALLMQLVEKRICDRRMLKLLRQWLNAGVVELMSDLVEIAGEARSEG